MPPKRLIKVARPLEAINTASVREKSGRHGHPCTLIYNVRALLLRREVQ